MLLGVPVAVSMLIITWCWLCRKRFNLNSENSRQVIQQELAKLGAWSKGEKYIAVIFALTACAWITEPFIDNYFTYVNDTFIAMAAALLLFIIPVDAKKRIFVMDWKATSGLPWGTLLLFGGGLSLAAVISSSGLALWISEALGGLKGVAPVVMMLTIVTVIIFLTEVTSNTATAAAFLPLLGALAATQGVDPQFYTIPAAIAASCAFMMPVATPPNTIVFGSGRVPISAMIRAGLILNIAGMFVVTGFCFLLVGIFK